MKKFSCNKDINFYVRKLIATGWVYKNRKKHACIIAPLGGKITVPCTPSDRRAFRNFKRDTRHLMENNRNA